MQSDLPALVKVVYEEKKMWVLQKNFLFGGVYIATTSENIQRYRSLAIHLTLNQVLKKMENE